MLVFYFYTGIFERCNLIVDIGTFMVVALLNSLYAYYKIQKNSDKKAVFSFAMIAWIVLFLCFVIFTKFPPIRMMTGLFGIPKF